MKRFLTLFCGVAIFAAAPTAQAQIEWAAGAPGGSAGGSIEVVGGDAGGDPILDTGIAASAIGGNRNDADLDGLPDSSDYTISAWIQSTVDDGAGNAADNHWWFGTGAQGIHVGILNGSMFRHGHWGSDTSGTSTVASNTWVHATYVFDADGGSLGTGSITIYRDGTSEGTFDTIAPNNSTTNLVIGARNGGQAGWVGFIDDVAVFDSALSAADVSTLAGSASQAVALGAVAYYDFEDSQAGTTAASAGSLGQTLTGIGDPLPPLPPVANWTTGAPGGTSGGAVVVDGANSSFLETGIPAADISGNRADGDLDGLPDSLDYTAAAWILSTEDDGLGNAADDKWWLGTGSQGMHLGIRVGDAGLPATLRHGHWGADNSGTSSVAVNTWVHATYVFDADGGSLGTGSITIYRDGVSEGTYDALAANRSNTDLIIGSRSGGRQSWIGSIDDVAIFQTALSSGQVATLAADTTQAISLGAVAYYDFEDAQTGTTAANAGTLGLAALERIAASTGGPVLKGDVDLDGGVTFLDIQPFINLLATNQYQAEADCDCDGDLDFLDIQPFINILAGL